MALQMLVWPVSGSPGKAEETYLLHPAPHLVTERSGKGGAVWVLGDLVLFPVQSLA